MAYLSVAVLLTTPYGVLGNLPNAGSAVNPQKPDVTREMTSTAASFQSGHEPLSSGPTSQSGAGLTLGPRELSKPSESLVLNSGTVAGGVVIVSVHSTVTVVSCSPSSLAVNQPSSCTVFVKDTSSSPTTPTGDAIFSLDSSSNATGSFPSGNSCGGLHIINSTASSCGVTFAPSGSGTALVNAFYSGDQVHSVSSAQFRTAVSGLPSIPVHPTLTVLVCSPSSLVVNQRSSCTAYVEDTSSSAPTPPGGYVSLSLDTRSTATGTGMGVCGLGGVNSTTNSCGFTFTPSGQGTALIVARYGGDLVHSASSAQFTLTVLVHPTLTVVVCSPSSLTVGQRSSCTVYVKDTSSSPAPPGGSVLFSLDTSSTAFGSGSSGCGLGGR